MATLKDVRDAFTMFDTAQKNLDAAQASKLLSQANLQQAKSEIDAINLRLPELRAAVDAAQAALKALL